MSGPRPSESRCFNENSPRPPVPGEERGGYTGRCQSSSADAHTRHLNCDATCASLDFEPVGRRDASMQGKRSDQSATAACLQWARNLHTLLEDPKGLELFEHYLQQEGHIYTLSFWFACEGLKEERDPAKLHSIIKVLIRRFFQRPQLALPDKVRKEMTRRFREGQADKRMFDLAQQEVERLIEKTTYPNFLRSEVYLQYVRYCQSAELEAHAMASAQDTQAGAEEGEDEEAATAGRDNECSSSPDEPSLSCASSLLPTLHEDSELTIQQQQQQQHQQQQQKQLHHHHHAHTQSQQQQPTTMAPAAASDFNKREMRLTADLLMATEQHRIRDVRPKPEAYAGIYLQPGASPYHASVSRPRAQYSSYNPVSRQDSELQSLSSDARTESDNLSLNDASVDEAYMAKRNSRRQHIRQLQQIKKSAMINRDPSGYESFVPRTQRVTKAQIQGMKPEEFAKELIKKLEFVKYERESAERCQRKIKEIDMSISHSDSPCDVPGVHSQSQSQFSSQPQLASQAVPHQARIFTDTLREKLQLEEDSDQAILDQHVSRVWSDLTPSRSPKLASPRPRSPDKCRRPQQLHQQLGPVTPSQQYSGSRASSVAYRNQRKEKDVFSTFSGDSGNVHDFPEAGELHGAGSMSSLGSHLPKSKSVPSDYADSLHKQDLYLQGQDPRYRRLDATRSSATKKSMTELTDSGVSVVSDVSPAIVKKDNRLLNWLKENDSSVGGKGEGNVTTKPVVRKKFTNMPQQPFVGDPGMPLLPQPHIPTQLEEAKRRLEYEQSRNRQRYPTSGSGTKQQLEYDPMPQMPPMQSCPQSNQSTLRRAKQDAPSDFTILVLSFCDEKVPYRIKISGSNVTLKQFKDVLPKKGNYRYFFKTECEDLDMQVIQEEITDDAEVLPLWEGKIMAQVKALE